MRHHKWTEEKLSALAKLFPVESTKHTATVLQMSVTAVKGKAKELGLKKETKSEWAKRADYVRSHPGESGIIYCATRKNVDAVQEMLRGEDIPVARYHAGMTRNRTSK